MHAFCEVVLFAVIVEYQENEDNNKDCLLEMLDPALHYLDLCLWSGSFSLTLGLCKLLCCFVTLARSLYTLKAVESLILSFFLFRPVLVEHQTLSC